MARKFHFRDVVQSFLIICEGKETEPLYFRAFRVPGDIKTVQVEGLGRSALTLVKEAIKIKRQSREEYDQVWCVFDIDQNSALQINQAIALANKNGIQVAYSNQAFEIWYLLHFHYVNTSVSRQDYGRRLSEELGITYRKNVAGLFMRLLPMQATAIERAKRLLNQYSPHNPSEDDPCTTVFRLVAELNRFTPDSRK